MKHILRIIRFTRELRGYYYLISALSILVAAVGLVQPLLSGWAIDELRRGTDSNINRLVIIVVGIFVSDLASNLISNINGYYGDQMSARLYKVLGERYYKHLMTLPQSYFDQELTGKIISRLSRSVVQITNFMQMWSNNFLQFIFSTVLSLAIVAYYSIPVALLLFTLYPIFILMTIKASGTWQGYQAKINHNNDIASGRFAESIGQIKVVKSFIQEKREISFFQKHTNNVIGLTKPQSRFWHTKDVVRRLALNAIFFAVYLFIFVQAANGLLTPGQAVALILYAMQIRIPIFTISFLVENTQRAIADSKDYFDIIALKPDIEDTASAKRLVVRKGQITFSDMSFAYGDKKVLKNINVTVKPDSKVALVGESGEGKTTLTNLLLRLYEPQYGTIMIDDQDISQVTQQSLRENIGVVFQDPALFSGTIRENISYGNSSASIEKITQAAKSANAHEFIEKLEKGYDTEIGERGLKLSGGQKQRIAIARALLKDAPILILDEATSSLDSKSEAMVQTALERLMKGRTTLIIAHRLSTIQDVDEIITLSKGTISEIGSPAQLSKTDGIYAQLLALQQGKSESSKKKLQEFEMSA
ncbi:MAG: ABC transporter ATP-binding protein [Candidatus Saccharibacteria bacterium]|nr:ABC transporter ATP-binding protein [Candidatus Saccharibacteria bacterium]